MNMRIFLSLFIWLAIYSIAAFLFGINPQLVYLITGYTIAQFLILVALLTPPKNLNRRQDDRDLREFSNKLSEIIEREGNGDAPITTLSRLRMIKTWLLDINVQAMAVAADSKDEQTRTDMNRLLVGVGVRLAQVHDAIEREKK
jgi:hypothetical protein